jgi:hypothetical protein
MKTNKQNHVTNLLWTSGWDSTYRLLDLLVVQRQPVQPYYVIDRARKSHAMELRTMEKIREMVFQKFPYTQDLLLPLVVQELNELEPNELITGRYQRLTARGRLGSQYEWLARFAEQAGLSDLEMSIETRSPGFFSTYVSPYIREVPAGSSVNYCLADNPLDVDLSLFKYFLFPLRHLNKLDLKRLARKYGFLDIMNETWFCHSPKGMQPCGTCRPCYVALEEGMRGRMPLMSQLRCHLFYNVRLPLHRAMQLLKKTPEPKTALASWLL